jgi:hypothetical protein
MGVVEEHREPDDHEHEHHEQVDELPPSEGQGCRNPLQPVPLVEDLLGAPGEEKKGLRDAGLLGGGEDLGAKSARTGTVHL